MAMKERGGTKQNQEGMPNVFSICIFSIRNEVEIWNFALAKLRGLCKYLANVPKTHSPVYGLHRLILCAKSKAEDQCNEASRPLKSSALSQHKIWRSLLAI